MVVVNVVVFVVDARPRATTPAFRFQNNFWVNLHHVVRAEARRRSERLPPAVKPDHLTDAERAAWSSALDAYVDLSQKTLFLDARSIAINNTLTMLKDDETSLNGRGLDMKIARALTVAAPIYRSHHWPAHRQMNDRWIAALQPMIEAHGSAMAEALAKVYRVAWPSQPIIVDASAEAGPLGGYTVEGPSGTAAHTVIESDNPEYQGDMAFEMVFHEASHANALATRMTGAIAAEAARQGVKPPRDLWHVVLFYTAGELARRELGKVGDAHYQPYAYRYQVYSGGWEPLRNAVVADWLPYLEGQTTFEAALTALVHDARQP